MYVVENLFHYYSVQEHYGEADKEKIKQLEDTVVTQTVNYTKEIEKIKKDAAVSSIACADNAYSNLTKSWTSSSLRNLKSVNRLLGTEATENPLRCQLWFCHDWMLSLPA